YAETLDHVRLQRPNCSGSIPFDNRQLVDHYIPRGQRIAAINRKYRSKEKGEHHRSLFLF
ncbi:MAG: hypothetical protein ACT4O9_13225, partial [Blastocatellia bacterium]